MKKYNTKRNHLKKNSVTRKHRGGKKRVEKVRVVFSRQYTNPDIFSMVRVEKGPQWHETDSQGEYLVNFASETAKDFEEELARILKGPPESQEKEKVYEFVFKDSDVALEPGADTPIKCKKSKKSTLMNLLLLILIVFLFLSLLKKTRRKIRRKLKPQLSFLTQSTTVKPKKKRLLRNLLTDLLL